MRKLLGRTASLVSRESVYQADDGFDVDSSAHYEVARRRVLFDDVQLVTIHHVRGAAMIAVTLAFGVFFLIVAVMILGFAGMEAWPFATPFLVIALPLLVAFFVRLVYGVDVVTIFGRRSKAAMRFSGRTNKAREVYGQVCAAVRRAQAVGVQRAAVDAGENAGATAGETPVFP